MLITTLHKDVGKAARSRQRPLAMKVNLDPIKGEDSGVAAKLFAADDRPGRLINSLTKAHSQRRLFMLAAGGCATGGVFPKLRAGHTGG